MSTREEQNAHMEEMAQEPASMSGDQISVSNRSMEDLAAGYDHINKGEAASGGKKGYRGVVRSLFCFRIGPPGGRRGS